MKILIQGRRRFSRRMTKGFALVVTLSLMILLTIIAVGLLSLSAVSLRSSSQGMAQAEAQANARLALMIAIGELQKGLGPDRRISANAAILDKTPDDEKVDDVANPHYLGVWDSWNTWLTDKRGSLTIQDTYKRGRDPSLFRTWLVSHPDADNYQTAITAAPTADMIELCGKGSAGPDPVNYVMASRIPVLKNTRKTGNYAWWVSDESQKARLDLKARDDASTIADAQIAASHTGRMGIEKLSSMANFDTTPESLEKMITSGQAGISAAGVSERFHDLTAYSLGLLTDVRSGGFKSDLNLAFESDIVPTEMDEAMLFGGRAFDSPIRPMTGELANLTPQNPYIAPMSWRQMREFYRVYREFPGDGGKYHPIQWNRNTPETKRFITVDQPYKWDTAGYMRQPVMLRQNWVLATSSISKPSVPGGIEYHILAIPVIYVWNPYNIAMRMEPGEISYLGTIFSAVTMWHKVYRGSTLISDAKIRDPASTQWGYRMRLSNGSGSGDILLQPGQVRVFSTDSQIVNQLAGGPHHGYLNYFDATPGYTPVEDLPGIRGLRTVISPGTASQITSGSLSVAIRLSDASGGDGHWYGATKSSAFIWHNHEVDFATQGAYNEDGSLVKHIQDAGIAQEWQRVSYMGGTSVDWFPQGEINDAWIIPDDAASRARWAPPGGSPMPIGIFSITAKCAERLEYVGGLSYADDFRNRTWLHAPHSRLNHFLMNPNDLNRADFPYQVHFRPVNGDTELSAYLQADGPNGFFGGGYTPSGGQTHISSHSLPISPTNSLASFAGIRVDHAAARVKQIDDNGAPQPSSGPYRYRGYYNYKHMAHPGGAFGLGIGNSYAHPMIVAGGVYTNNNFGIDPAAHTTSLPVVDDYWDHLFLSNEELWDSWFCSGIAPATSNGSVVTPKKTVAEDFFSNKTTHLSPHFMPDPRGKTPQELASLVETTSAATGTNGWDLIGSHILNKGQFNVNSTSKEAWKALLMSLADRPIASNDPSSGPSVISRDKNQVTLSRHPLANSMREATGPGDENAWRGIRKLNEPQIDKLAEEIVRQVKLRGPFLNMAEFINRRLSTDDTGVTGALQAAIDWDEFNAGYDGRTSGTGESINDAYKGSADMISRLPATYPNPKAAKGSRYAGIPGYVMQSDLLQGISSSLCVRGDTFVIRAYGESLSTNGKVAAAAWCEAVVQRIPDYSDPADPADKKMRTAGQLPDVAPALKPANLTFGRQFKVTSFRWLHKNEI